MTERVYAWTLDHEAFHRWLVPLVVRGSELDVHSLRAAAAMVFSETDVAAADYREALGFSRDDPESWESTFSSDPDIDARDELYAIAMGGHLRVASDISCWSHSVAFGALRRHGWEGDPSFLWRGHGLETLAAESGSPALAQALARARRSLGGWMSVDEARAQLEALRDARSRPLPGDVNLWFEGTVYASLTPSALNDRIALALSEFSAVMEAAVDRREALRLVLWS